MSSGFTMINCDAIKSSHMAMMKMGFKTLNALTANTIYQIGTIAADLAPIAPMYTSGYATTVDEITMTIGADRKVQIITHTAISANRNIYGACPAYFIA